VDKDRAIEKISITIGIILFSLAMLYIILSNVRYNYPNYSTKFLLETSFESAILILALLLYVRQLNKINKTIHLIK